MSARRVAFLAVALLLVRISLIAYGASTLPPRFAGYGLGNDARRYHDIAQAPGTPYRDFEVEVPPLALLVIEVMDGQTGVEFARRMVVAMLALDIATAIVLWIAWGRDVAVRYWVIGTPLAFFIYFRLDMVSVFLAVLGVASARRRYSIAGGASLCAACLAKIWPLVLLPSLWVARRHRAVVVAGVLVLVSGFAWMWWVGIAGPREVLTYRGATGWEIESDVGLPLWIIDGFVANQEQGALRVGSISPGLKVALLAATAIVIVIAVRRGWDQPERAYGALSAASVAALLTFAPVFSHQYLVWLLPWVAIERDGRLHRWMVIAGISATVVMLYTATHGTEAVQAIALGLRNVAVIVIMWISLRLLGREQNPNLDPAPLGRSHT